MAIGLPALPGGDGIAKRRELNFRGYDHNLSASEGAAWDMENMSSALYPIIAPREPRVKAAQLAKPNGLYARDALYWVDGTGFYRDGVYIGEVADSFKTFGSLLHFIVILPDKVFYNAVTGELGRIDAEYVSGPGQIRFSDGTFVDETAKANSIITTGAPFPFNVGDAVFITGCTVHPANNTCPVIREISDDKKTLRFYENVFDLGNRIYISARGTVTIGTNSITTTGEPFPFTAGQSVTVMGSTKNANNKTVTVSSAAMGGRQLIFPGNTFSANEEPGYITVAGAAAYYTEPGVITLRREMPDIEFICENENRLWGCKGNSIYATKLGDVMNWNVFEGLETDSFAVDTGSAGSFTGCCSFLGYPVFFKEEHIYKMYGTRPSNFQLMGSATLGVAAGSSRSLAIAGETLFYLSRAGIAAYSGGMPQSIAGAFGEVRYSDAAGGSDGLRYFVSMRGGGGYSYFVYDTQRGMWMREDDTRALGFAWRGGMYYQDADGGIWRDGRHDAAPADSARPQGEMESTVESFLEFGDFYEGEPNKKGVSKLQVRVEVDAGAALEVLIRYDSKGEWETVRALAPEVKRSYYLPVIPRRCDHFRIRLAGFGDWRLYSLVRETYTGSEM